MKTKDMKINGDIYQIYDMRNGAYTCFPNQGSCEYVVAWNKNTKPFIMDTKSKLNTYNTVKNFSKAYKLNTNCTKTLEGAIEWVSNLEENRKDRFEKGVLEDK